MKNENGYERNRKEETDQEEIRISQKEQEADSTEEEGKVQKRDNTAKRKGNRRSMNKGAKFCLHLFQHICLITAAVTASIVLLGSFVMVETKDGAQIYSLASEESTVFTESNLFNQLLGKSVSDVICYGAIRGQMETTGKFDPKKEVDVTAFANRYEGIQSEYITARYYLEDLIKWSQNGFAKEDIYMTGEEADDFLSRSRTVTMVNLEEGNYSGGTVSYLNSDVESFTRVVDVSGNIQDTDGAIRDDVDATVLNNRYHTVEGKNIENYVSSWDEYYELCGNIQKAASDLNTNYNEYLNYNDYYDKNNTNVVYYIRRTIGDKVQVFSNYPVNATGMDRLEDQLKKSCGKYIIYDPQNMEYDTNTLIEEATLRYILNGYEYSYPENTQVLIGVNTDFPAADAFYQAGTGFSNYAPYFWQYLIAAIFCSVIYLFLLIFLTMQEGRARRKDTGELVIRLHQEDRIPTEIMLAFAVVLIVGFIWTADLLIGSSRFFDLMYHNNLPVIAGISAFIASIAFSFFYYSFVRRWKAHTLWQNSLLKRLFDFIKRWILYTYDNVTVVLRVWIPYVIFVMLNLGLLLIFDGKAAGIILVLIIDLLVGALLYHSALSRQLILEGIKRIKDEDIEHKIDESKLHGDNLILAQAVNGIGDGIRSAVATSMKDERLKADLITNVSHDIKTPLTSIINYVDLIKRENIDNKKVREYIDVLDVKSQRLKQLTDDLVEASKISSGNIALQWDKINLVELLNQTIGEFSEKFEEKALTPVFQAANSSIFIEADSRRIWRVIENLFNNIFKYALQGTRVYINLEEVENESGIHQVALSIKNISANPLKVNPEELTERFIRGDESRTTEGSGLGLSIAKNLTEAQKGKFEIAMDGDLFKVILTFPLLEVN